MKIRFFTSMIAFAAFTLLFSSCTAVSKTMREPNIRLELAADDFSLSDQVSATATSTRIIGIDWQRLFNMESATTTGGGSMLIDLATIPVLGPLVEDPTANFAMYELMQENPGYDVVIYPQFESTVEKPILGIGFIMKTTTVTATARLGKLNQ